MLESSHILKPQWIGKMMERQKGQDPLRDHVFDFFTVMSDGFRRIYPAPRLDPAPFDTETVDLKSHFGHKVDIFLETGIVVVGADRCGSVLDFSFSGKSRPVVIFIAAFNLGSCCSRAQKEAFF